MTSDLAPTALAPFVRILGRGPGRSRNLTPGEAFEAMQIILSGRAAPEAVGAFAAKAPRKSPVSQPPCASPCRPCPRSISTGPAMPPGAAAGCRGSCSRRVWWL